MNVTPKTEHNNKIEKENNNIVLNEEDTLVLSNANMPFSNILTEQLNNISSQNFDIDFNYDSLSMDFADAMFFINLAKEGLFSVTSNTEGNVETIVQTEIAQTTTAQKTVEVTNKLTELIEKAQNTQKPVRISFDNDVSVILKIDKHGKLTAEFIPGNVEVENYLRNNIASLKQRFDEQNLPYNDLLYRQNEKQNRRQDKERGEK